MIDWVKNIKGDINLHYEDFDSNNTSLYECLFHNRAAAEGKTAFSNCMSLKGCKEDELDISAVVPEAVLLRVVYDKTQKFVRYKAYAWDEGAMTFEIRYDGDDIEVIYGSICTTNKHTFQEMHKHFSKWEYTTDASNEGRIYTIVRTGHGLEYSSIGIAKLPFIRDNYEDHVIRDADYIIKNLQGSTAPVGRIVLLNGEPGTGKTHLIRAIISSVEKATFLLVSPDLVGTITGPELMNLFINNSDEMISPLILVIEDADSCLVDRSTDNMSLIYGLLNISDGIVGNMIDIRIIATTNAELKNIDKAILRPGRLLKRIDIGKLSPEKAASVYKRLTGREKDIESNMTLAEVYYTAREENDDIRGEVIQPTKARMIGFGHVPPPVNPVRHR